MSTTAFHTVSLEEEHEHGCPCCGRPVFAGCGELHSTVCPVADYWYRWAEGHSAAFHLAVCARSAEGEFVEAGGVAVLAAQLQGESLSFSALEPEAAPWREFGAFGRVLSRAEVLGEERKAKVFALADAVVDHEPRLRGRLVDVLRALRVK
jgi:hypothetical protein